jgi:rhodanese-related sulfurtransferase
MTKGNTDMTATQSIATISPAEVAARVKAGERVEMIDVRTPVEFVEVHAAGARNVPLDRLDPAAFQAPADEPLYVICKSGARAAKACQRLIEAGVGRAVSVEGGTDAWVRAGLPVERRPVRIPLQRQALLGAGLLVLLGFFLGTFVSPWFYGICAFVGVGLSVAGLTGFCGMALLLSRMPWNRYETVAW